VKIAVTGGIGSGKSSVAALLADAVQADLFSADLVCHELMQPDADGWLGIVAAWGERYLKPDRSIDRASCVTPFSGMRRCESSSRRSCTHSSAGS